MLRISETDYRAMRAHGEESYPRECCGALLGRKDGGVNMVEAIVRAENVRGDSARTRYEIAPSELIAIQREARGRGLEIVGFYHSHPDHPARWSETDLAEAHWISCSYVITAVAAGVARQTSSFRLAGTAEDDKQLVDEPIEIAA
jgi:proteasome lid subunit RPN8/RPN11